MRSRPTRNQYGDLAGLPDRVARAGKEEAKDKMVPTQKIEVVEKATDRFNRASAVVVMGYQGMTVAQLSELRAKLRAVQGELRVIKNRLSKRALEGSQSDKLDDMLVGPSAVVFGYGDAAALAKACTEYAKTNDKMLLKGGLLEKRRIDAAKLQALAKLPSRQQLLGQMAATLMAPARQMATAMNQAMAKIVYAMKARADQMGA